MSYEPGGRADKFGNRYESRFILDSLIDLIEEKIRSVAIEPIGEFEEGVDVHVTKLSGEDVLCQCKGRNGNKNYWNLSELASKDVFNRAGKHLRANENCQYILVSPFSRVQLSDLVLRARNSSNSEEFYQYQIKKGSKENKEEYERVAKYFELDISKVQDQLILYSILRRFSLIQFSDDTHRVKIIQDRLEHLFIDDPTTVYTSFLNYLIENDMLGNKITSKTINDVIRKLGFEYRDLSKNNRIMPRISELNKEYIDSFIPINDSFINRKVVEEAYEKLCKDNYIVIHGKAGTGKSGCVKGMIDLLDSSNTNYLVIRLDNQLLKGSLSEFGKSLGLPSSPIECLDAISKDEPIVLVLDQLDAIRWTNVYDSNAINICNDVINRVLKFNESRNDRIRLVFVTRTFDMHNDIGISNMLNIKDSEGKRIFNTVEVGPLDEDEVDNILGNERMRISNKLYSLLRKPSNLYIWTKLDYPIETSDCISSYDLVEKWWEQIMDKCDKYGFSHSEVDCFITEFVNKLENNNKSVLPQIALGRGNIKLINILVSQGLLNLNNDNVRFVHQSFYDNFIVKKMIEFLYGGVSLAESIASVPVQSPLKRYQLQIALEILNDRCDNLFIIQGKKLLNDENVRFYIKYVFLEVLGQIKPLKSEHKILISELLNSEKWSIHVLDAVVSNNIYVIEYLIENGTMNEWFKEESKRVFVLDILRIIEFNNSEITVDFLKRNINKGFDTEIYNSLNRQIHLDSDKTFDLRKQLLRNNQELCNDYIDWATLAELDFIKAVEVLKILVEKAVVSFGHDSNIYIHDKFSYDSTEIDIYSKAIAKEFSEYVMNETKGEYSKYDETLSSWSSDKFRQIKVKRVYVDVLKNAIICLLKEESDYLIELFESVSEDYSAIMTEIILESFEIMDTRYSDCIINWLCEDPNRRFFNYSGVHKNRLYTVGNILKKHTLYCSDDMFKKIEKTIIYFKDENMVERARMRFEYNSYWRKTGEGSIAYFPYWGMLQYDLLKKLNCERISAEAKRLIEVLDRKFEGQSPHYFRYDIQSGTVTSALQKNAKKLTVENWVDLINSPIKSSRNNYNFCESSEDYFARDLEKICKEDYQMLRKIAAKIDRSVNENYIVAIFDALSGVEINESNIEEIESIILKLWIFNSTGVAKAFCRILSNKTSVKWGQDILDILVDVACNHEDPILDQLEFISSDENDDNSIDMLHTYSINCTRGCSFNAIANLISTEQYDISTFYKAIQSGINDISNAVKMAVMECVFAASRDYMNEAYSWFISLIKEEIRLSGHPNAYQSFYYFYDLDKELILDYVIKMCDSEIKEVSELGFRHLANFYVLYNLDFDSMVELRPLTVERKKTMIDLCASLFKHKNLRGNCKKLIFRLNDDDYNYSDQIRQIFYDLEEIDESDIKFLADIISNNENSQNVRNFTEILFSTRLPIEIFANHVQDMALGIINSQSQRQYNYHTKDIANNISILVVTLYDRTKHDINYANKWITLWDAMFEKRMGLIRDISKDLINL